MKLLCLDLSTKSGWSVFEDGKLLTFGLIKHKVDGDNTSENYPMNYISAASLISIDIKGVILNHRPNYIIIEETNSGRNRFSQKTLEFIHYAVNEMIFTLQNMNCCGKVHYLDTSEWRCLLGISLSTEDRQLNKEIKSKRDEVYSQIYSQLEKDYQVSLNMRLAKCLNKREQNKVKKLFSKELEKMTKEKMRGFRVKNESKKVIGKVDFKTLSVEYVNQHFNLNFKKKDNDVADSICLGAAFLKKIAK